MHINVNVKRFSAQRFDSVYRRLRQYFAHAVELLSTEPPVCWAEKVRSAGEVLDWPLVSGDGWTRRLLHPKGYGGILPMPRSDDATLWKNIKSSLMMVVVNCTCSPTSLEDAVENID